MLAYERDKLNQMALLPVAPAYSAHELMKTPGLAELPKTRVQSTPHVFVFVCVN